MIGAQVGVYRVIRQIGQGGMGTVWLAEHVMLGRPVAIKVLHREASVRPELVGRFFVEARAATAISDPGIIQIFDFGHHTDGNAYIVMELLEGEPLDQRLRRMGTMPPAASLRILRQVASSLGAAHRRGIVHRDMKPDNIFLVRDPEVAGGERTKILDFGIAKISGDRRIKTQTSAVMGTPVFMSPEQCRGAGQVDQRSDVYSLGCVLFTLLTGRPPFDAEGAGDIIAMHLREPAPAPSSWMPGLPPAIDELVLRCLAKERERRFESGTELAAALEALIEQLAPQLGTGAPRLSASSSEARPARPPTGQSAPEPWPGASQPPVAPSMPQPPSAPPRLRALSENAELVARGLAPSQDALEAIPQNPRWPSNHAAELPVIAQPASVAPPFAPAVPAVAPGALDLPAHAAGRPHRVQSGPITTLSPYAVAAPAAAKRRSRRGWAVALLAAAGGLTAIALRSQSSSDLAGDAGPASDTRSVAGSPGDAGSSDGVAPELAGSAALPSAPSPALLETVPSPAAPEAGSSGGEPVDAGVALAATAGPDAGAAPAPAKAVAAVDAGAVVEAAAREAGTPRTATNLHAVLRAFARWAPANAGKPCPSISSFGLLLDPSESSDAWGSPLRITCSQQPARQRIGVISAGPDRAPGTADDLASWQALPPSALDAVRGPRWGSAPAAPRPSKPKFVDKDGDGIPDNF